MKLETGDYISRYDGDCSPKRDKTKDKYSVRFYPVVDIIPDPSGGKPTITIATIPMDEVDRMKKHYWFADVAMHYNIVYRSDG